MSFKKILRWAAIIAAALLVLCLLAVFTLPWWLGVVLGPVTKGQGLTYGEYEVVSYGQLALREVDVDRPDLGVTAEAETLIFPNPVVAGWRYLTDGEGASLVAIENFTATYTAQEQAPEEDQPPLDLPGQYEQLTELVAQMDRAGAVLRLVNGEINAAGVNATIEEIEVTPAGAKVLVAAPELVGEVAAEAQFQVDDEMRLRLTVPRFDAETRLGVKLTDERRLALDGEALWREQPVTFSASWQQPGLLPATASAEAERISVAPGEFGIEYFDQVTAGFEINYADEVYSLEVFAEATPQTTRLGLAANGTLSEITVQDVELRAPYATISLSKPLTIPFEDWEQVSQTTLDLSADLAAQPFVANASGNIEGQLVVRRPDAASGISVELPRIGQTQLPFVRFELRGSSLGYRQVQIERSSFSGELDYPALIIEDTAVTFPDGSVAALKGAANLAESRLERLAGTAEINPETAADLSRGGLSLESLKAEFSAEGPFSAIRHEGKLEGRQIAASGLEPMAVDVEWSGQQSGLESLFPGLQWRQLRITLDELTAQTNSNNLQTRLGAAILFEGDTLQLQLDKLGVKFGETPAFELAKAAQVEAKLSGAVRFQPIELADGEGSRIRFAGQLDEQFQGRITASAANLSAQRFGPVMPDTELPDASLADLQISAGWQDGPVDLEGRLRAIYNDPTLGRLSSTLDISTDSAGFNLAAAEFRQDGEHLLRANAQIPVTVRIGSNAQPQIDFDREAPLDGELTVAPDSQLWEIVYRQSNLALERPSVTGRLQGSMNAPDGRVVFDAVAGRYEPQLPNEPPPEPPPASEEGAGHAEERDPEASEASTTADDAPAVNDATEADGAGEPREYPILENPRFVLTLDRESIALQEGGAGLLGRQLRLTGRLPMGSDAWNGLLEGQVPSIDELEGRMRLRELELRQLGALLPEMLREAGTVSLDLQVKPGMTFGGFVDIKNLQTRPISGIGSVDDVTARIKLNNRELVLEDVSAEISDRAITMGGTVDLSGVDFSKGMDISPVFDLQINGERVPLFRQPGLIVRGSPDITIETREGQTFVEGELTLVNSFMAIELASLTGGGGGGGGGGGSGSMVPGVDAPIAGDWRLDLRVYGNDFMQVRAPFFAGPVSVDINARGTVSQPFLVGDATVVGAYLKFPFGSLEVESGGVNFIEREMNIPQLDLSASGRVYSVDVRMQAQGTAQDPNIIFTSTPAMPSSQILLMLTTGQVPSTGVQRSTASRVVGLGSYLGSAFIADLLGSEPGESRFTLSSGEEITESGRNTLEATLRLTEELDLVGSYDRFDAYNFDLEWTVYKD